MDDDARREFLAWIRDNDRELDALARRLDFFENRVFTDVELSWAQMAEERRNLIDIQDQLAGILRGLNARVAFVVAREDELSEAAFEFIDRIGAMRERVDELQHEMVRLMGEIGRAHDRRRISIKRAPGAHSVYR